MGDDAGVTTHLAVWQFAYRSDLKEGFQFHVQHVRARHFNGAADGIYGLFFGKGKTNLRHSRIGFRTHIFLVLPWGAGQ